VRIHLEPWPSKVFRALKIDAEEAHSSSASCSTRWLTAAPPHGGSPSGLDVS